MSRALALEFVRGLLEDGYTAEHADRESLLGYDKCDGSERSYVIRRGRIQAPFRKGEEEFSFRALARELTAVPALPKPMPAPIPASAKCEQLQLI